MTSLNPNSNGNLNSFEDSSFIDIESDVEAGIQGSDLSSSRILNDVSISESFDSQMSSVYRVKSVSQESSSEYSRVRDLADFNCELVINKSLSSSFKVKINLIVQSIQSDLIVRDHSIWKFKDAKKKNDKYNDCLFFLDILFLSIATFVVSVIFSHFFVYFLENSQKIKGNLRIFEDKLNYLHASLDSKVKCFEMIALKSQKDQDLLFVQGVHTVSEFSQIVKFLDEDLQSKIWYCRAEDNLIKTDCKDNNECIKKLTNPFKRMIKGKCPNIFARVISEVSPKRIKKNYLSKSSRNTYIESVIMGVKTFASFFMMGLILLFLI